jgi:Flp pilus assembly CpaE family ATPase
MLDTVIFGSDDAVLGSFYQECVAIEDMVIQRSTPLPSTLHEIVKVLSAYRPHIVFLEVDSAGDALSIVPELRGVASKTCVIGFAEAISPFLRQTASDAGVDEVITAPFTEEAIVIAARRALQADQTRDSMLLCFQPASGGAGATYTALNTASSLAHDYKKRVLFIEADLHSGPVRWLADVEPVSTLAENLERSHAMGSASWQPQVTSAHGLDWLLSPTLPERSIFSAWDFQRLLSYSLRAYDRVVVDLPVVIPDDFMDVAKHADRICVVSRPNTLSLAMARRRITEWEGRAASDQALTMVVADGKQSELSRAEMEALLHRRIEMLLPVMPGKKYAANLSGIVSGRSPLARAYRELAAGLGGGSIPANREKPSAWKTALTEQLGDFAVRHFGRVRA